MMSETVSTINGDDKCHTCGQTMDWHQEHKPVHPFNRGEAGATAFLGDRKRREDPTQAAGNVGSQRGIQPPARVAFPCDPILRQALIDKGVLTPEDLKNAEEKIVAITGAFTQAMPPPGTTYRGGIDHGQQQGG
jgi:hypothetical protein